MKISMGQKQSGRNFRRITCMLFAVPAIGLLCGAASVERRTDVAPFSSTLECGPDTITIDGTASARIQIVEIPNGNLKIHLKIDFDGSGTSTAGASYNLNEQVNLTANQAQGETVNAVLHGNLIGQGQAPNYKFSQHFHYTIDANGDLHAERDNTEGDCTVMAGTDITQVPDMPLLMALLVPGLLGLVGVGRRVMRKRG